VGDWLAGNGAGDWAQPAVGFSFADEPEKASFVPIYVGTAALVLSIATLFISSGADETSPIRGGIALLAYALTPLVTAVTLVWAMKAHRSHGTGSAYDAASGNKVVRAASVIAILGFVAAIPQIWILSDYMALVFGGGM